MFEDKLHIEDFRKANVGFAHTPLLFGDENFGEFMVFLSSYIVNKDDAAVNDNINSLEVDIEFDNFAKVYAFSHLMDVAENDSDVYSVIVHRFPLVNGEKEGEFVRKSIIVSFPNFLGLPPELVLAIGTDIAGSIPLENLDVKEIVKLYNSQVDEDKESKKNKGTICLYKLPNLYTLYSLPFAGMGKVYKVGKEYVYETNTMLFDFLDECREKVTLCEENIVIDDVSKMYECCKNKNDSLEETEELDEEKE